jgi:hypothetical protein
VHVAASKTLPRWGVTSCQQAHKSHCMTKVLLVSLTAHPATQKIPLLLRNTAVFTGACHQSASQSLSIQSTPANPISSSFRLYNQMYPLLISTGVMHASPTPSAP